MAKIILNKKKKDVKKALPDDEKQRFEETITESQLNKSNDVKKSYLIIGEGETEEAYFDLLKFILKDKNKLIEIVIHKQDGDKKRANNILPLAEKAELHCKTKKYDAIWIVLDNDEGNSFKLGDNTFNKLGKAGINLNVIDTLKKHGRYEIEAPFYEFSEADPKKRWRFFLSEKDYKDFLATIFQDAPLSEADLVTIIANTEKNKEFETYFKQSAKNFVPIAYSCIAFEHWLLLHYEASCKAFQNSREICSYLITKLYFENYEKGTHYFRRYHDMANPAKTPEKYVKIFQPFKAIIEQNIPVLNNILMNQFMRSKLQQQNDCFYEVNPYSTIFELIGRLTGLFPHEATFLYTNQRIQFGRYHQLIGSRALDGNQLTFKYCHKAAMTVNRLKSLIRLFCITQSDFILANNENIIVNVAGEHHAKLILPQNEVEIWIHRTSIAFLELADEAKHEKLFIILG